MDSETVPQGESEDKFVLYLNQFIDHELEILKQKNLDSENRDRFLIYKQAFNKLISYLEIYRNLLINIKREYEFCIEELEKQNTDVSKKADELIKCDTFSQTIINLENRKFELLKKFGKMKQQNVELNEKLDALLEKNEKYRPKKKTNMFEFLIGKEKDKNEDDKNKKVVISGLSLDKTTDLVHLSNLLKEVDAKIKELNAAQAQKYSTKQQKKDLEATLFKKIAIRDEKKMESYSIKNRIHLYKIALNSAKEYYSQSSKYASIEDALSKSLVENFMKQHHQKFDDEIDSSEDFGLEHEAEIILDHIERFNDLFENAKFIEAAYFAAASPKNILKNIETLYRFKGVSDKNEFDDKSDPLMVYCEAIIDSVNEKFKPDETISIECIKIALKYNKLEYLSRWIAQKKLTFSYEAGKCIENYSKINNKNPRNSIELALFVYNEVKAISKVALCMAKLGRYTAMFDLISKDKEMHNNIDDWLKIFKQSPSIEFANLIVENLTKNNSPVPIDQIVSILLDSDQPENGLKFLKDQITKISNDDSKKDEITKLKTSYETLVKFSYLAQDEEQFTKEIALKSRDQLQNLYSLRSKSISFKSNHSFKTKLKEPVSESIRENDELEYNSLNKQKNEILVEENEEQ